MTNLNKDEFGQVLRANIGLNVSVNIGLEFILEPRIGKALTKADVDGVTVGTNDVVVGDQTFMANEYIEYTTQDGDIDQSGVWRIKGAAQISSSVKAVGDYRRITVLS